jgi:hypothetical protein
VIVTVAVARCYLPDRHTRASVHLRRGVLRRSALPTG